MPVLPIPMIIALALFVLMLHRLLTRETHISLLLMIGTCALLSAVIALVQYYGISTLRPMQALLATMVAGIIWLAFSHASKGATSFPYILLHGFFPILGILALVFIPYLLDILIPLLFAGYGIAILIKLQDGEETLPYSPLDNDKTSLWAWRIIAISMIASAFIDGLIAYNLLNGDEKTLLWLPSVFSSFILLCLGILSLSQAIENSYDDIDEPIISDETKEKDQSIITKLDAYVETEKPYLDPDLTLSRLSKKLHIPAKQLSTAINRVKGENISKYVNRHRIEHACQLMSKEQSVTQAMLSSGFNTKSNFNREFLRVKGKNPRAWLGDDSSHMEPHVS